MIVAVPSVGATGLAFSPKYKAEPIPAVNIITPKSIAQGKDKPLKSKEMYSLCASTFLVFTFASGILFASVSVFAICSYIILRPLL